MKGLLVILLFFIFSFPANSERMQSLEGLKYVTIGIEKWDNEKECGLSVDDVRTEVKFIINNSKLKQNMLSPTWIYITLTHQKDFNNNICYGNLNFEVKEYAKFKTTFGAEATVPIQLWRTQNILSSSPNNFSNHAKKIINRTTKEFINDWYDSN